MLKLRYVLQLFRKMKFKKIYNLFWCYCLWLNYPLRTKLISKFFPKIFKEDPYPPFLEVETTTKCPFRCKVCEHTYWDEPAVNMSFDDFVHIADQFPKLKWAGLTGIGESWANPRFGDMVEYLVRKSDPVIELVDNFSMMTEDRSRRVIELGVDIFFISIMGATKETYEKIMRGMNFDNVIGNIEAFFKIRDEFRSVTPLVNFHYVISRSNIDEAVVFLDFASKFKGKFYSVLYTPLLHAFDEVDDEVVTIEEVDVVKEKLVSRGKELGVLVSFNECLPSKKLSIRFCSNWIMPFIFVNGDVSVCCTSNEANQRQRQYMLSMGNIFQEDFEKIWWGDKYTKFRKLIRSGSTPDQCKDCPIYLHD